MLGLHSGRGSDGTHWRGQHNRTFRGLSVSCCIGTCGLSFLGQWKNNAAFDAVKHLGMPQAK